MIELVTILFFFTLFISFVLAQFTKVQPILAGVKSIEGLRGLLAIMVVFHHFVIWKKFAETGRWLAPDSNFLNQLGNQSVTIFFLVTGFLFGTKLVSSTAINWTHFFKARFMRLFPAYFISILLLIGLVFYVQDFTLHDTPAAIVQQIAHWISFTYLDSPDINSLEHTSYLTAGVFWSLRYEWLFYFSIPLLGVILFKRKASPIVLIACVLLVFLFFVCGSYEYIYFIYFAMGMACVAFSKNDYFRNQFQQPLFSLASIGLFAFNAIYLYDSSNFYSLVFLALGFIPIACGNHYFGLLETKGVQLLGRLSYSIYILHGLFLFFIYGTVCGMEQIATMSIITYAIYSSGTLILILLAAYVVYTFIEAPALEWAKKPSKA